MNRDCTLTDTYSLEIPKADTSLLKSLVKRMGWTIHKTTTKRTEVGKRATKALRREGLIPCNLYGQQKNEHRFVIFAIDIVL